MAEEFNIRILTAEDMGAARDIFNYFALNEFAVYCEFALTSEQFAKAMDDKIISLAACFEERVVGYSCLTKFKPFPNFARTALLAYFIKPEFTGKGLGSLLLDELFTLGKQKGITNYLAHISSKNEQSLNFHRKHGFVEAGRFFNVADKFGEPFDIIWMQKQI
ncbi:MAG: N-acetyltransferase family protein [Ignavibacteria bacterium]|nr:N-acetyltransferase family protein [Ignavibacteria bacterium]